MTKQEYDGIVTYFKDKPLANSIDVPGTRINNCKSFVETNILRMTVGSPYIQDISYDTLNKFRQFLDEQ